MLDFARNNPKVVAGVLFFLAALIIVYIIKDYLKSRKLEKNNAKEPDQNPKPREKTKNISPVITIQIPAQPKESWKERDARREKVRDVLYSWGIPAHAATTLAKADLTPPQVKAMSYDELLDVPGISHHWARKVLERTLGIPFEPVPQPGPMPIPEVLPRMSELPVSFDDLEEPLHRWYMEKWWLDHLLAGSFGKREHFPGDFLIMSEKELDKFLRDYRFLYDGRRGKLSDRRIDHIKEIVRRTKEEANR